MFDYQKKSVSRFSFYLAVLTLVFLAGSVDFYAQAGNEKLRNAAITPEKLSASFAEVAKTVEPAVVNIDTKGKVPEVTVKEDNLPNNKNTEESLEEFLRLQRRPSYAVGSGFIVDK